MDKKQVYRYLEDNKVLPSDPEAEGLTELLRQLEELKAPDPGLAYWNQFNRRIQARISVEDPSRSRFSWLSLPVWVGLAAAVFLAVILLQDPKAPPRSVSSVVPSEHQSLLPTGGLVDQTNSSAINRTLGLEKLNPESLAVLLDLLTDQESFAYDEDPANLADPLRDLEVLADDFFNQEDYSDFDGTSFKALWGREG